jgi:hypothetical protein
MVNRRPNTTCDVCDKPIYRRPNLLEKNKTKACSHSCSIKIYQESMIEKSTKKNHLKGNALDKNPAWKGGVTIFKKKGNYINVRYIRCPKEYLGMARKDGYVMEHRLIMAKRIGRILNRVECVHHRDHNPTNNEINNLLLFPCNKSHKIFEGIENRGIKDNLLLGFNNIL